MQDLSIESLDPVDGQLVRRITKVGLFVFATQSAHQAYCDDWTSESFLGLKYVEWILIFLVTPIRFDEGEG